MDRMNREVSFGDRSPRRSRRAASSVDPLVTRTRAVAKGGASVSERGVSGGILPFAAQALCATGSHSPCGRFGTGGSQARPYGRPSVPIRLRRRGECRVPVFEQQPSRRNRSRKSLQHGEPPSGPVSHVHGVWTESRRSGESPPTAVSRSGASRAFQSIPRQSSMSIHATSVSPHRKREAVLANTLNGGNRGERDGPVLQLFALSFSPVRSADHAPTAECSLC